MGYIPYIALLCPGGSDATDKQKFASGAAVMLDGFGSRTDLNGKRAVVESFDAGEDLYQVKVEGTDEVTSSQMDTVIR